LKNESKVPDEKVAENKNIDDMKNGSIALLKDTKELIKTTSSSEDVESISTKGDTCICLPTGNSGGFLHISAALCVTCRPPIPTRNVRPAF
jgi:hypothetical protein